MYLRTTKRKNKNGTVTEYLQLAHNERNPETNSTVARIIHSFGRADQLDREALVRLARSIARVCGVTIVDPAGSEEAQGGGLPDDLEILRTVELGTVLVIETLWERLGIGKALRSLLDKGKYAVAYDQALLAMTANRLCAPESKLGVWDRWLEQVHLPKCQGLKLRQMYEAMDFLHKHIDAVEEAVFFQTANLFNLSVDLIFYDTTTASFSIDYEDEADENDGLRQYGHSKEGTWTPQIVVALAVTREGLPVKSWIFPGNTADVSTIKRIRKDLRGWNLGRALFVADSGMNSSANREELARACGKYLLAPRMATVAEIKKEVLSQPGRFTTFTDNLQAKEVVIGDGERRRRYILCFNPKEAERQRIHREEIVGMLEEELANHKDRNASTQWAVELLASKRYKRYLTTTEAGKIRLDRAAITEAKRYDGKWVLETNDDTISLEDAALGYKGLLVIERCFRSLKRTQIKMMPMYHWAARRIETHVKICVLALLIERVAERECGEPWSRIRRNLAKLQATEFQNDQHSFFQINSAPEACRELMKKLVTPLPTKIFGIKPLEK
nr:IS1634 family transposase [uncultured Desulfobulbus sp.]